MFYLDKQKKHKAILFKKWVITLFFIIIFFVFKSVLQTIFSPILKPILQTETYIVDSLNKTKDLLTLSKKELIYKTQQLQKQNEELVFYTAFLENQQKQYATTVKNFGIDTHIEKSFTLVPVIYKPNKSLYDTLFISKGSKDEISLGSYVYADNYSVIGIIDKLYEDSSVVKLFSNPRTMTHARLERSGYDVTLVGRGGGNMIVEIPKEIETALGDRVLYPELSYSIVGVIRDITLDERSVYKKLYITLPTNILTLDSVYVKKP